MLEIIFTREKINEHENYLLIKIPFTFGSSSSQANYEVILKTALLPCFSVAS